MALRVYDTDEYLQETLETGDRVHSLPAQSTLRRSFLASSSGRNSNKSWRGMCVKLASDSDSYSASSIESLENVISGQFGDGEHEYGINFALAGIPYPLIVP